MSKKEPTIGITMGDPKGIGPEVIAKAWKKLPASARGSFRIYGDRTALRLAAELAHIQFDQKQLVTTSSLPEPLGGANDDEIARITLSALDAAIADVRAGRIDALVTG